MTSSQTIVLVTGSNGGIGFDTVAALAAASSEYHVLLCSRSQRKGQEALGKLQARKDLKGTLSLLELDVTSKASIAAALEQVSKAYGKLDVLINNAGIISTAANLSDQLEETFKTNTIAPALVTEAFLPLLKKATLPGGARIVHVSSGLGSIANRGNPSHASYKLDAVAYRMSKSALNMLAVSQYATLKDAGIKVWAMCPGYVVTNLSGETGRKTRMDAGALSSETSAQTLLQIVEGARDKDVGGFVHKDGTYPW